MLIHSWLRDSSARFVTSRQPTDVKWRIHAASLATAAHLQPSPCFFYIDDVIRTPTWRFLLPNAAAHVNMLVKQDKCVKQPLLCILLRLRTHVHRPHAHHIYIYIYIYIYMYGEREITWWVTADWIFHGMFWVSTHWVLQNELCVTQNMTKHNIL